jgi:hypothetical protein
MIGELLLYLMGLLKNSINNFRNQSRNQIKIDLNFRETEVSRCEFSYFSNKLVNFYAILSL